MGSGRLLSLTVFYSVLLARVYSQAEWTRASAAVLSNPQYVTLAHDASLEFDLKIESWENARDSPVEPGGCGNAAYVIAVGYVPAVLIRCDTQQLAICIGLTGVACATASAVALGVAYHVTFALRAGLRIGAMSSPALQWTLTSAARELRRYSNQLQQERGYEGVGSEQLLGLPGPAHEASPVAAAMVRMVVYTALPPYRFSNAVESGPVAGNDGAVPAGSPAGTAKGINGKVAWPALFGGAGTLIGWACFKLFQSTRRRRAPQPRMRRTGSKRQLVSGDDASDAGNSPPPAAGGEGRSRAPKRWTRARPLQYASMDEATPSSSVAGVGPSDDAHAHEETIAEDRHAVEIGVEMASDCADGCETRQGEVAAPAGRGGRRQQGGDRSIQVLENALAWAREAAPGMDSPRSARLATVFEDAVLTLRALEGRDDAEATQVRNEMIRSAASLARLHVGAEPVTGARAAEADASFEGATHPSLEPAEEASHSPSLEATEPQASCDAAAHQTTARACGRDAGPALQQESVTEQTEELLYDGFLHSSIEHTLERQGYLARALRAEEQKRRARLTAISAFELEAGQDLKGSWL